MAEKPRDDRDDRDASEITLTDEDEQALRWDGETDVSHVAGPADVPVAKKPRVRDAVAPATVGPATEAPAGEAPAGEALGAEAPGPLPEISALLLVTYGILAGMYGLFVIGWIVAINRTSIVLSDALAQLMFTVGQGLAIGAAPLWFAAVFVLTRKNRAIIRLLWLLLGLVVVAPWPAILGGA
jgi:hypothetical protein